MNVTDRSPRLPLSPQEGWISDGRQMLHFRPARWDRLVQRLQLITGELLPDLAVPLLKRRQELSRKEANQLWRSKQQESWKPCPPQW